MTTEQKFKQIYQDLKNEIINNSNTIFLREYTIPSINYNINSENLYFISRIKIELYRMMEQFENKIYFARYKDQYFFSNDVVQLQKKMALEIKKQEKLEIDLEM